MASLGAKIVMLRADKQMDYVRQFHLRHRRLVRVAWLVMLLMVAACQPDTNGSGGDGY